MKTIFAFLITIIASIIYPSYEEIISDIDLELKAIKAREKSENPIYLFSAIFLFMALWIWAGVEAWLDLIKLRNKNEKYIK